MGAARDDGIPRDGLNGFDAGRDPATTLRGNPLFRDLPDDELRAMLGFASQRRFSRGVRIFARGDPGSSMLAVLSGQVRIGAASAEGRELTHVAFGPGDIFGELALLDGKPRSADAVAAETSALLIVERRHFMPFLLARPALMVAMLAVLCDRLRRTNQAAEAMALLDVPGRLGRLILDLSEIDGPAMSQAEMAARLGTTRESVNKQLQAWLRAGAIERRDGRYVPVLRDRLRPDE